MMLTGVTEITRNASSASRGLVMISSRLTQVLDSTSSTGKKLTKIYNDLGIALKDENGQLRSHYDILGDLAVKWNTLSENEQKYIALTSAGARQQQNFVALMENWNQVASATTTAYESMGSAQRENEKVMDSVAKKVEILRSEFQQIVIGDGGLQEFAKGLLDIGIAILKFANSDVSEVIIKTTALIVTLGLLNKGFSTLSLKIIDTGKTLLTGALALQGYTAAEIATTVASVGLADALKLVSLALLDTTIAFVTSPFGMVAILIAGVTAAAIAGEKALEKYRKRLETANEQLTELSETAKDAQSELDNLNSSLKSVQDQINKNNETKLKITDSNELLILDKENEKLLRQEETLKRQIVLQERKLELAQKEAELQAKETLKTTTESKIKTTEMVDSFSGAGTGEYIGVTVTPTDELQLAIDKYKELKEVAEELQRQMDDTDPKSEEWENLNSKLEDTQSEMQDVENRGLEMSDVILNAADNINSTDDATSKYKDSLYDLVDSLYEVTGTEKEINDSQEKTIEELEEEAEAAQEISDEIEKMADSLGITATELAGLKNKFDDITLHTFLSQLTEARQKISDTSTVIDNLQDALTTASNALDEYNQNGYLTIDTFQSLMGISAQYLAALVNENGQLEINQKSLGNLIDQLKIAKIEELADAAAMEILALRQQESATTADEAQRKVDAAGDAFTRAGNKASKASAGLALFNAELAKATGGTLGSLSSQEKAIVNKYENLAKEISTLTVNTTKAGNAAKSAGKKGSGAAKEAKSAVDDLNKSLQETLDKYKKVISWISTQYDKEIDSIKDAKDEAIEAEEAKIKAKEKEKDAALDYIQQKIDALEKEKKALKAQKEVLDDRKEALKDEEDAIVDGIEKRIKALEKERDAIIKPVEDKIKALEKERDAIVDSTENKIKALEKERDAIIDATQAEIDSINELKEARQNYWDEQIDALKKANQELKDNLELQEKLDALEKAKNTKVKIYKEGQGFVYDVDQTEVDKAQKALDEYLSQKAYEDELERLENLKDAEIQSYNDRLKELNDYKDKTKKSYDEQLDNLKEYKDNVKDNYDKQLDDLNNYKDNVKENYSEQIEALKEYKETVQEEYAEKIKILEDDIDALEAHMSVLDEHKEKLEEHKDEVEAAYEAEIELLNEHKDNLEAAYDAEIEMYEDYKQAFEDMVNAYEEEQNRLLAEQLTGISFENNNWMTRLDNLANFVNEYNRLQAQLDTGTTDATNTASMSSGGGSSSTSNTIATTNTDTAQYDSRGFKLNEGYTSNNSGTTISKKEETPKYDSRGFKLNYASGIDSIKQDQIAIVGENPNQEIVIGSKINNGELMSLDKGTGIVNAGSSKTLAGMLNQVGQFGSSGFGSGNGTLNNNINNDSLVVNGVTIEGSQIKDPETFVNGLLNLKAEALQRAYRHR